MTKQPEWISLRQAAEIIGASLSTVYRSVADPAVADEMWGSGNWRRKPLSRRGILQVRPERAREIAAQDQQPDSGAPDPADRGPAVSDPPE